MTIIDIILIILLASGALSGLSRGFFKELAGIAGLIIGLIVARELYLSLAEQVAPFFQTSITVAQVISFIAIWLIVPIGFSIIASILTRAFRAIALGWLNHLAGAILGLVKSVLIIGLLIWVVDYLDTDSNMISKTKKEESLLYYPIKSFVGGIFFPIMKKMIEKNPVEEKDIKKNNREYVI